MSRYAVIDEDGIVLNIVEWDGETPFTPKHGQVVGPVDATIEARDVVDGNGSLLEKWEPPFDEELAASLRELDGA